MYCKKRNEPDGLHLPPSLPPKRPMYLQKPEAQSRSSLDSEPTSSVQQNLATPHSDAGYSPTADRKYAVVTVGKRSCTRTWRTGDVEGFSKRSQVEYSDATGSGVTFQKGFSLHHHARNPDAESESSASVGRYVGSCNDAVCLKPKRLKLGEIDADKHGICTETDADKHATYICSRVQESRGNLLSVARQCTSGTAASSISYCEQSIDGSLSYSANTFSLSRFSDSSRTTLADLRKAKAGDRVVSSRHVVTSPQMSSKESEQASVLHVDAMHTKGSPPSYVLSSGRLSLEQGKLWFSLCTVFSKEF